MRGVSLQESITHQVDNTLSSPSQCVHVHWLFSFKYKPDQFGTRQPKYIILGSFTCWIHMTASHLPTNVLRITETQRNVSRKW